MNIPRSELVLNPKPKSNPSPNPNPNPNPNLSPNSNQFAILRNEMAELREKKVSIQP